MVVLKKEITHKNDILNSKKNLEYRTLFQKYFKI